MVNKSSKCNNIVCQKDSVIPVCFRNDNRSFLVAFYLCKECNELTGFLKADGHMRLPLLSELRGGMLIVRLVKETAKDFKINSNRKKILQMMKNKEPCIECGKKKLERLYVRNRPKYQFIGYVCRKCKVIYLINFKSFRLRNYDNVLYKEFCKPRNPEIPKKEFLGIHTIYNSDLKKETENISITIRRKDIPRLRKILEKHKIKISSSSNELTPFFEFLHH